jgi:hypothetical protein
MRKLFFGAFLALLMLLVLPGAVSASNEADVNVIGQIGSTFDITVGLTQLRFGEMSAGNTYTNSTTITVTTNLPSWRVDASDKDAGTKGELAGYMITSLTENPMIKLQTLFELGKDGTYGADIANVVEDYMTGDSTGGSATVNVQQQVVENDPAGNYFITVYFTGGAD